MSNQLTSAQTNALFSAFSVLYQLQPTIKAQQQLYERCTKMYFSADDLLESKITLLSKKQVSNLLKLINTKKLTPAEKIDLANICWCSRGYIEPFSLRAKNEGFSEKQIDLFVDKMQVSAKNNRLLAKSLMAIVSLQQDKILSDRLQLLV